MTPPRTRHPHGCTASPAVSGRARGLSVPGRAFTLMELLVTVGIIGILAMLAMPSFELARMRSKLAVSKYNIRLVGEAMEVYRMDHGSYPQPIVGSKDEDPYGVIATSSLRGLTTPIAYVNATALHDSFGLIEAQVSIGQAVANDPFRPPTPDPFAPPSATFNQTQSLLYFYYPKLADLVGGEAMRRECYAIISVGPDLKDSFIAYYPFPACLPATAAQYGITQILDTIYDPTNGTESGGDLAGFGPEAHTPTLVGGGDH